jgi:hypothetical protein
VTMFYLNAGGAQSAAYVQEWDTWREGGAKVVLSYGDFDDGLFKIQQALAGSAQHILLATT